MNRKLRVLFIIPSLIKCGPTNVVFDLTILLINHGHECKVLYFDEKKGNLHDFPCKVAKINSDITQYRNFDIIHCHGFRPAKLAFKLKKDNPNIKTVNTIHSYIFKDFISSYGVLKGFFGSIIYLLYLRKSSALITLSRHAKQYYSKFLSTKLLHVINNTRIMTNTNEISDEDTKSILKFKANSILLGSISVINKRKSIETIITALTTLPKKYKLIIIGDGPQKESLKNLANSLNITSRVYFLGNRNDAYRYLSLIDIYILASKSEGFPLSLLEAGFYGKQIICSDLPVVKESFNDDKDILLFKVGSAEELSKKILAINDYPQLGINCKIKCDTEYSPEVFYKKHLDLYYDILNS